MFQDLVGRTPQQGQSVARNLLDGEPVSIDDEEHAMRLNGARNVQGLTIAGRQVRGGIGNQFPPPVGTRGQSASAEGVYNGRRNGSR